MSLRSTLLASFGAMALATAAHATTFDLATVASGTTPTFGITSGGITATFSSPAGNGFAVGNTAGLFTFSPALQDQNFFGSDNLTISFSKPVVDNVTFAFGFADLFPVGTDSLTVSANTGQTATYLSSPDSLPLGEPEGFVKFRPTAGITSLTLSSSVAFAIGNVTVPEPMSIALLATGLVGLAASRRRAAASA